MSKRRSSIVIPDEVLVNKIYLLRNQKIMLDRDLAELYGVKSTRLREQVKRNKIQFPKHFMFQLSEKEVTLMVSQNAIPSKGHLGGFLPYAFTEHGVMMLANVLKSKKAIQMSIRIIEVFIKMREMLLSHKEILLQLEKIETRLTNHDNDIQLIFKYLKQLLSPPQHTRRRIGFRRSNEK